MIDLGLLWVGWLSVAVLSVQAFPVTRLVYAPTAVSIAGDVVTAQRTFPGDMLGLARPVLSYVETVRPMSQAHHGGQVCTASSAPIRYARADVVGRWSIADWASDCISDPLGYVWSARWTWHVGGVSFGPVSMAHTVLK